MNGYNQKKEDLWRLYGTCGMCKQSKWFIKRIEVIVPAGSVISPSHFCKKCYKMVVDTLTPKQ